MFFGGTGGKWEGMGNLMADTLGLNILEPDD